MLAREDNKWEDRRVAKCAVAADAAGVARSTAESSDHWGQQGPAACDARASLAFLARCHRWRRPRAGDRIQASTLLCPPSARPTVCAAASPLHARCELRVRLVPQRSCSALTAWPALVSHARSARASAHSTRHSVDSRRCARAFALSLSSAALTSTTRAAARALRPARARTASRWPILCPPRPPSVPTRRR